MLLATWSASQLIDTKVYKAQSYTEGKKTMISIPAQPDQDETCIHKHK